MTVMLLLLLLGLLVAAYRDVLTREVPDTISYGLITLGLLGGLITALIHADVWIFYRHLAGFALAAVFGLFMYFTRQWGGGDAKLLMGVGSILGFWLGEWQLIDYIILLVLGGAVYGLLYTIAIGIRHRKTFLKGFRKLLRTKRVTRARWALLIGAVTLAVGMLFVGTPGRILIGFMILALYAMTYTWICTRVIENDIMTKTYPVGKLTEGDWLTADVKRKGKTIVPARNTGMTEDDIKKLKEHKVKTVTVREGIPFVPSFVLAFILLVIVQSSMGSLVGMFLV